MSKKLGWLLFWSCGLLIVAYFVLISAMPNAHSRSPRISCANNLKQVGVGLKMWAGDHGKVYPNTIEECSPYLGYQAPLLICPSSGNAPGPIETVGEWTDYIYITGLSETNAASEILIFCPPKNHKGKGGHILFLDGRVKWFNSEGNNRGMSFEEVIRKAREQLKP